MKLGSGLRQTSQGFDWGILIRMGIVALVLFIIAMGTLFT